jgi:hypothetical protein
VTSFRRQTAGCPVCRPIAASWKDRSSWRR